MKLEGTGLDNKQKVTLNNGVISVGSAQLDVTQLCTWLGNSLKILSVGNGVVLHQRKFNLKPFLDHKFHHLLCATNPVTQELLGVDLEQKIADGKRALEVGRNITPSFRWHNPKFKQPQRAQNNTFRPAYSRNYQSNFRDRRGKRPGPRGRGGRWQPQNASYRGHGGSGPDTRGHRSFRGNHFHC